MNITELKARLKTGDAGGWYILSGEEEYLKRYYRAQIKQLTVSDDDPFVLFSHTVFDGAELDCQAFMEAVKAPPMMADKKLIEWRYADISKLKEKEIEAILALAEERGAYPYATVVISALPDGFDVGTQKKPSKLFTRLSKHFDIITFEKSTDSQLSAWIIKHFAAEGISAGGDVAAKMLMKVGHSMQVLSLEIKKLTEYAKAHKKSAVFAEDVNEICSGSIESDAFAISNAIIEKNTEKAYLALFDMKMQKIDSGAAIAQLSKTYGDLMSVAMLVEEGKDAADISAVMKVHPYKAGLYISAAKKLGSKRIAASLASLIKTDAESKAGGISGYEAVEIFIAQNIGR
jgi:DNA polymerase-3 subunit delta